jgi:alpha-methylacyl-CoA racemase
LALGVVRGFGCPKIQDNQTEDKTMGPLKGLKIIEMAGIGPGPFCAMLLADMGADVIRIDRPGGNNLLGLDYDVLCRGRRSIALDLKNPDDIETLLKLVEKADTLLEGFRPGVMERLGLGPDVCCARNERLVFGRMTGWGQDGPMAQAAGHDINYISLVGALHAIGTPEQPVPPLNMIGDFGGGALYLAFGLVSGMLEAKSSGRGQVVDTAMTDGASHLMAMMYGLAQQGRWSNDRGTNLLDGGAPFYGSFQCSDGKWISLGSIEPQFYALLLEKAGITDPIFANQLDQKNWPEMKEKIADIIRQKNRDEWCEIMEGSDVCFAPVLDLTEAPEHAHNKARGTFVKKDGYVQPGPAPRFSRTSPELDLPPPQPGEHSLEILKDWGIS